MNEITFLIIGLILGLLICFVFFFISKKKQNPMEESNFNELDIYNSGSDKCHIFTKDETVTTAKESTEDISKISKYEELPIELHNYVSFIEEFVGVPIKLISVGPDRSETIYRI